MAGTIVAAGGWGARPELLDDYVLALAPRPRPRVLYVPTANGESAERILDVLEELRPRAEVDHVRFFPWPPPDLRERVLAADQIWVSGGNTANMLAIWRVHGFDALLRDAWQGGAVLYGGSAGGICWFEGCVTDSFGPQLAPLRDGLGFLPGSCCPHYDGDEKRRPAYTAAVRDGVLPPGWALDEGVAVVYAGADEVVEVVSAAPAGRAYRVTADREEPVAPRPLA